ncbi:MAG: sulfur carrier protein ThiS adenylyltransferase ThiF [Bacteroidota bacterium]
MNRQQIENKLSGKIVGIAGCGGLGTHAALSLARAGVGTFFLVDFDIVQENALHRQCFMRSQTGRLKMNALKDNIQDANPDAKVYAFDVRLCPSDVAELFQSCDVLIEAVDAAKTKQTIIESAIKYMPDTPVVSGVGLAGYGKTEELKVHRKNNLYICGDLKSQVSEDLPHLAPRIALVAAMQANTVLEILLEGEEA